MEDTKKQQVEPIDITEEFIKHFQGPCIRFVEGRAPTREEAIKLGLTPPAEDPPKRKKKK